jgi:hypothetical protein
MADLQKPEVPKLLQRKDEASKRPSTSTLGKALGTEVGRTPTRTVSPPKINSQIPEAREILSMGEEKAKLAQRHAALGGEIAKAEQQKKEVLAQGELETATTQKRSAQTAMEGYNKVLKDFPGPEFHPTPNNIQSLATIFGLTALVGETMGGEGQMSAMNALSSMNGMMQGWQQGKSDLWQREKIQYEQAMNRVKSIHDTAYKAMDTALKTLPYDREEGMMLAKQAAVALHSPILMHLTEQGQVERAHKLLADSQKNLKMVFDMRMKQEDSSRKERAVVDKAAKTEKKSTKTTQDEVLKIMGFDSIANGLEELKATFKPEYASLGLYGVGSGLSLEVKRRKGNEEDTASVAWWGKYNQLQAPTRHALFGATLTGNELKNFQSFTAKDSDAPNIVKSFLDNQIGYLRNQSNVKKEFVKNEGVDISSIKVPGYLTTYDMKEIPAVGDERVHHDGRKYRVTGLNEDDPYDPSVEEMK